MGRKNGCFYKVKKALVHDSNDRKAEKTKNKWFGKKNHPSDPVGTQVPPPLPPPPQVEEEDVKLIEVENEHHVRNEEGASQNAVAGEATEAPVVAPQVATSTQITHESNNGLAAIRIQTAFRSYMARKAFRAQKGLVRLKSLVDSPALKRRTSSTLKCIQTLSRVQSQIQSRRIRMLEENRALERQILQKRAKELESLKMDEDWDDTLRSKEKMEVNLLRKYEAATRRERALAYSYTHQQTWKKSTTKPINLLFMDPTNPQWGWSWLERWMVPHSNEAAKEKDLNGDQLTTSRKGKISTLTNQEDDSKSTTFSIQSDKNRRHTMPGSSVSGDDESLGSSSSVPSYMAPTHSAKAKLKAVSPLGAENKHVLEKSSPALPKKRLSFPPSPSRPRKVVA